MTDALLPRPGWRDRPDRCSARPARRAPADAPRPYPLLRRFLTIVAPVLLLALAGVLYAVTLAISTVVERVSAVDAAGRHGSMVGILAAEAPEALAALAVGRSPEPADAERMEALLDGRARSLGLT